MNVRSLFCLVAMLLLVFGCKRSIENLPVLDIPPADPCRTQVWEPLDSVVVDTVFNTHASYRDFVVTRKGVVALSESGKLFRWQPGSRRAKRLTDRSRISAIALDKDDNIYFVEREKNIYRYDAKGKLNLAGRLDSVIHRIAINSKNEVFAITSYGIHSMDTQQKFFPDSLPNNPFVIPRFWYKPSCTLVDSADNLWIGFHYGEWGGNLISFNTITRKFNPILFDSVLISWLPVMSVFEGAKKTIYATNGLAHFSVNGAILAIESNAAHLIYDRLIKPEEIHEQMETGIDRGEYIGPGAFDQTTGQLLYYSNDGFFYATFSGNLFCKGLYYKPRLTWGQGQKMAVGPGMNVTKIHFLGDREFLFLTSGSGIGYLNHDKLTFLK